jgi:hypothetical protein
VSAEGYRLLADATLVLHALFVGFVILGQLTVLAGWAAGWHFTRGLLFRLLHLGAIGFVVLEAWFGVPCPATLLENLLRGFAGEAPYPKSFVGHWLSQLIFYRAPDSVFLVAYSAFGALVVVTFWLYPPRRGR